MEKPTIKLNGGDPVSLCSECHVITHYVTPCEDGDYVIRHSNDIPPLYCEKCGENKSIEKAKDIIKSCTTQEHFDTAVLYLDQYLKLYSNPVIYKDLIELIGDRKTDINFNTNQ